MATDFLDLYASSDEPRGYSKGVSELEQDSKQPPIEGGVPFAEEWTTYPRCGGYRVAAVKMGRVSISGLAHSLGDGGSPPWEVVGDYARIRRQALGRCSADVLYSVVRLRSVLPTRFCEEKRRWLFGEVFVKRFERNLGGGRALPRLRTIIVVCANREASHVGQEMHPDIGGGGEVAVSATAG